jgi:hypothetical protein
MAGLVIVGACFSLLESAMRSTLATWSIIIPRLAHFSNAVPNGHLTRMEYPLRLGVWIRWPPCAMKWLPL